MRTIEVEDLCAGYVRVVDEVLSHGSLVAPRGVKTVELCPAQIMIRNPRRVVPVGVGRRPRLALGAAESMQLLGGVSDAAMMVAITKNFEQFVEGGRLRGAYGPRSAASFRRVVDLIAGDPDTRQAVVGIWRPGDLAVPRSRDVPCTTTLQFLLRGGLLDMVVTMRSNDVFWGLAYDAWMFANAQCAVAYALNIGVGTYYHNVGSLHAYVDRDHDALDKLYYGVKSSDELHPPMFCPPANGLEQLSRGGSMLCRNSPTVAVALWNWISQDARNIVLGSGSSSVCSGLWPGGLYSPPFIQSIDPWIQNCVFAESAKWYYECLSSFVSPDGRLCPTCLYVLPSGSNHFKEECRDET